MSKNTNYLNEIKSMQEMVDKMKASCLREGVNFDDNEEFDMDGMSPEQDQTSAPNMQQPVQPQEDPKSAEDKGMEELDKMGALDTIRKITLQGMTKLSNSPENPEFQALLKIFTICNKPVDKEEVEQAK